jgi:hypothetical protein
MLIQSLIADEALKWILFSDPFGTEQGDGMVDHEGRIDLEKGRAALAEVRSRYQADPGSSQATLRATARLVKDTFLEGRIGRFTFECDEPPSRGGEDKAPSPLEYFLIGAAF